MKLLIRVLTLMAFLTQASLSHSFTTKTMSNEAALDAALKSYASGKTLPQVIDANLGRIAPDDAKLILLKIQGGREKPQVIRKNATTFIVKSGTTLIPVEILSVSDGRFKINNRHVTLTSDLSSEERWARIMAVLPSTGQTSLRSILLPFASAAGPLLPVVAVGAVMLYLLGMMVYFPMCETLNTAWGFCNAEIRNLHNRVPETQPPSYRSTIREKEEERILDVYAGVKAVLDSTMRSIGCPGDMEKLRQCSIQLEVQAREKLNLDLVRGPRRGNPDAPWPGQAR